MDLMTIKAGSRYHGELKIRNSENSIPITVLNGTTPGKTLLITAGVHSTEYVGIQTAAELAKELSPARISGRVIIIPTVNVSGFVHRTQSVFYEDGKDLYKIFPGDFNGTEAEKTAATLADMLMQEVDYYVDLHGGDRFELLIPHVFHVKTRDEKVAKLSLEMAKSVDAEYRIEVPDNCEGAVVWAAKNGIPGILIERGGMGRWSEDEVEKQKQDVLRIMGRLGILKNQKDLERFAQAAFKEYDTLVSPGYGLWYPSKKPGDAVFEGDICGYVKNIYGEVLYEAKATRKGMILYQVASLNVIEGDVLVAYTCY